MVIDGALLILSVLTSIVGLLLAADAIGALLIAHLTEVPFVDQGVWELLAPLSVGALQLTGASPVRWRVNRFVSTG